MLTIMARRRDAVHKGEQIVNDPLTIVMVEMARAKIDYDTSLRALVRSMHHDATVDVEQARRARRRGRALVVGRARRRGRASVVSRAASAAAASLSRVVTGLSSLLRPLTSRRVPRAAPPSS